MWASVVYKGFIQIAMAQRKLSPLKFMFQLPQLYEKVPNNVVVQRLCAVIV
jgi:hypothetical protein